MCRSSHRMVRESWSVERPRPAARTDVRVSDADREAVIDQLSRHTGEGRLTLEEFEGRVEETWQSKTQADLRHVLRELPAERGRLPRPIFGWRVRAAAFWTLGLVAAAVVFGPEVLWWLLPLAWFKFGWFGPPRHHGHDERPGEISRGDDLTLV